MRETNPPSSDAGSEEDLSSSVDSAPDRSRLRTYATRGAVLGVLLLALTWMAAATGFGMGAALPYALERFSPDGWTVELGSAEGSWLSSIELRDVSVSGPEFSLDASRLLLRYRVRPLLSKRLEIREVALDEPVVGLSLPDSAVASSPDTATSPLPALLSGRPAGAWSVSVDTARLNGGRVEVRAGERPRYALSALQLAGSGGLGETGLAVHVDSVGASFVSTLTDESGTVHRSEGRLALAGELSRGTLSLDTLYLTSDLSRVTGGGLLTFVDDPVLWGEVDLDIEASPLDLRDLPVELPEALHARPDVHVRLIAGGSPDSLMLAVDGETPGGEGTIRGEAVVRRLAGQAPAVEGAFSIDGLDLAPWLAPPFDGIGTVSTDFTLSALQPGADYSARGSLRHEPRVVDSARLVARPLTARFDVEGSLAGASAETDPLVAEAEVALAADRPALDMGTVFVEAEGTTARWRADLRLEPGTLAGSGNVAWGPEFRVETSATTFEGLDLSALDSVYPATRLTGRLEGDVRGEAPQSLDGVVELALAGSRYAELDVDTLALTADLAGQTATGTVFAVTSQGEASSRYSVELVDSVLRFEADSLSLRRDDVGGAFHGRASGRWTLSDVRAGDVVASVDSARWGSISLARGEIDARLSGDRIEGDAELTAAGVLPTPLRLRANADVDGLTPAQATGRISLSVAHAETDSVSRLDTLHVQVTADEPGRFALEGVLQPTGGGRIDMEGSATAVDDSLSFDVAARGSMAEATALLGGASLDSLYLTASGRRLGVRWEGVEGDLVVENAQWQRLRSERALASIVYDSTGLRVDTLDVRSNVFSAFGTGRLPAEGSGGSIEITADILDLDPLRELGGLDVLAAGDGTVEASLAGALDSLAWQADMDLEALVVNEVRMTGVRFDGEGVIAAPYDLLWGLSSTDMHLAFDRILLPDSEVSRVTFGASGGADSLRVEAEAIVDEARQASAILHLDPRPEGRRARIEDIRFRIDEDQWSLVDQAVLQYGSGVSVEPVLLRAGEQEIRLEGGVSETGALDLNARMDSTDVSTVADLAGLPRLRGWLSGRVRVQGTTDSPEAWLDIAGALHRQGRRPGPVAVRVRGNGRRIRGDIELFDANQGVLRLTGGGLMPGVGMGEGVGEPSLAAMTNAPPEEKVFGLVSDSLDVRLEAEAFDLRWTEAFFTADLLATITGRLDGSIGLTGSSADPELSGAIRMRDGAAHPTALGVRYDAIRMTLRGDGTALVVDSARISGSSGVATASGTVETTGDMPIDLVVGLDGFRAIRTDAYWAVVSGSLDVEGVAMAPVINGDLRLESLDVFLDERVTSGGLEPVELTEDDLRMLRERFGIVPDPAQTRRPFAERITADLEVELGRDSWLRKRTSPEMAVPFSGTMQVELRPAELPSLQGSVDVIAGRGFVEQFGRRFELSAGTVTFNGAPAETRVDLEATYTIPSRDNPDDAEVTIILEVAGTQEDLSLTLSSNPPLENADIVSYIATGRPAAGSLSFEGESGGGGLVAAGADFALSQMTSLIETAAAGSVGLDVVEIRREGLRQATLVAGKYVTPRLYVGFAQPISLQEGNGLSFGSEGRSELEVEYEAWRWLLLNVEGSGSSVRFFLRGRRAY